MNITEAKGIGAAALIALALSGCGAVTGQRMVRVVESAGSAEGGSIKAEADAGAHGCRVETTEQPIEGELNMTYSGAKCSVIYKRP